MLRAAALEEEGRPIKLTDLEPRFFGSGGDGILDEHGNAVPKRTGVGFSFNCPCGQCGERIALLFKNPVDGGPAIRGEPLWDREGDTFETMTLRPSILRLEACHWHGWIQAGAVTSC